MASSLPFSTSRSFSGPLASTSSYPLSTRQLQVPAKPAPVLDLLALQSASQVLQDQFIKDVQAIPDLSDTLTTRECICLLCFFVRS